MKNTILTVVVLSLLTLWMWCTGFLYYQNRELKIAFSEVSKFPPVKTTKCLGLNETKNVWNRIRVDDYGFVMCSKEKK